MPERRGATSAGLLAEARPMLRLAGPVILAEVGWMAMGLVDIAMVGPLGPEAIGAAGVGNVLFMSIAIVGIGLLFGLDTVVSQAFGAGRLDECRRALGQGVWLALGVSPILVLAIRATEDHLGRWGVDAGVVPLVVSFVDAIVWSVPLLLVHTACRRYLQALGVVRPIAVALIAANLLNLGANWVLVYGHLGFRPMGVAGSAWSTVLARAAMAAVLVAAVWWRDGRALLGDPAWWRPERALMARLLGLGWPAAAQLGLEVGVFGAATVLAGRLGAIPLAAHEVALNVCGFTFMVPLGLSSAGAVRVGQALGRGDPGAAGRAGWSALLLGSVFMGSSALAFLLAPTAIFAVFTADEPVIALGVSLLGIGALFQLFDGLQVVATGILRGAGDTRTPMICNVVAYWLLGLPIGAWLTFGRGWGITGLWAGLCLGLMVTGSCLLGAWGAQVRRGFAPAAGVGAARGSGG